MVNFGSDLGKSANSNKLGFFCLARFLCLTWFLAWLKSFTWFHSLALFFATALKPEKTSQAMLKIKPILPRYGTSDFKMKTFENL
jgi:hypothetical protein